MGVQGFQEYLEKHFPSAVVPVELHKLAQGSMVGGGRHRPPQGPLRLLLDAESCLHRLYGGFYSDWVSGGQWNNMFVYLSALSRACFNNNIELMVCFNGALEKGRLHDWVKRQVNDRQTSQQLMSHVQNKGTPPPKVWFLPPVCLVHFIRLALLKFRVRVVQSLEDHHLEVMTLYRENGFHGLLAYDSDYALCNVPNYFSSYILKLSRNGKSLTTSQFLMEEVAQHLQLDPSRFVIFACLLGNHILPDEDLATFHWRLLGPKHPLVSLKVRAHQLVLPPCDVVIEAVADFVRNIQDTTDLDAIAKDIFQPLQSCTEEKVMRFKKAMEYYSSASKRLPSDSMTQKHQQRSPVVSQQESGESLNIPQVPSSEQSCSLPLAGLSPVIDSTKQCPLLESKSGDTPHDGKHKPLYERSLPINPDQASSSDDTQATLLTNSPKPLSEPEKNDDTTKNDRNDLQGGCEKKENSQGDQAKTDVPHSGDTFNLNAQIPSLLSMPTRSHMDLTTPPLPTVAPEVLRVAEHRHRKGLMHPNIYHILTKGEVKLLVTIEDEATIELPSSNQLFRPVRQYVYGVLFSLAEDWKKAERLATRKCCLPEYTCVMVKEWSAYKGKSPDTPELVEALTFREWTCPNLKKLWLGRAVEDKNRRMRAFLACMRSDTPAMLNPTNVPASFLVLCCVLRFMLQWPGVRVLRRNELDAFLAQAVSAKLFEPDQLQELKIDVLDSRGVQLAALFMSGVDMALLANDSCGQPVPWEHCCPWMFFDGKLFQSTLIKANRERAQLIDLCDGQTELVAKVEKMRQSILEGLNFTRPAPLFLAPPPPPCVIPFYSSPAPFYPSPFHAPGRGRGLSEPPGKPSHGGKLEIAGTVVGQWAGSRRRGGFPVQVVSVGGPNRGRPRGVISTPVIRTFGRGGTMYPPRVYKSQNICLNKPAHQTAYTSQGDVVKEKKGPEEEKKSSLVMCDDSTVANGIEHVDPDLQNGDEEKHAALI
ncbi:constitutive coactivator of PPAR-gamma-like protein 1 homolog [Synchiropus splendidus]|uniref:constitutive coactivator of PPAR-gamma-like protein 1 homolog n=1 Tax=Synchiropus splendidus TaxID=270530 RepID=UPI00237E8CE4|nr:constitutive coactivator of PPAR-gamma-like protein 1 homolog [Synchiropus splendidus]